MDIKAYREEIKLRLTGGVLELELTDDVIDKVIYSAFRELQRYICSTTYVTIPYSSCIDMTEYKVSSVSRVYRATGYIGSSAEKNGFTADPMAAAQWQLLSGTGNLYNLTDYAYNYAAWNTLLQIRNTTSTDLAFRFDKSTNNLYVNVGTDRPDSITVEYVPHYENVSEIKSDFWIDMLMRLSVALTKVTLGRVRSRYTQANALWQQDGEAMLAEGNDELKDLREYLSANTQLVYPID